MKLIALISLFFSVNIWAIKVVHYNIKELDSTKIQNASTSTQLIAAKSILKKLTPDILSLNEIQFDMPAVPNQQYQSRGQNLHFLNSFFETNMNHYSFFPANTGMNSRPNSQGEYILRPTQEERELYADKVNFGMFPAQYSMGGLFQYQVVRETNISNLKWKDFNPNINLSKFTQSNGAPLPEDMSLFDKNFVDTVININGKEVHIILLHTVPSFHFGNMKSPNYERNRDQLKFLQWYLKGSGEIGNIRPLPRNATFIAMGDWNVDPDSENLGAQVINELKSEFKMWMNERVITYRGSSFIPGGWTAQLDYILLSNDISILDSGVYGPEANLTELGCNQRPTINSQELRLIEYRQGGKTCFASVSKDYYELKTASDHLPLWVNITLPSIQ